MGGAELVQALEAAREEHRELIEEQRRLGIDRAKKEREYRMAKRKQMAYERSKGTPVTIIADMVKGCEHIADLAFERDCAEVLEGANKELIMASKREIDMMREQLSREYQDSGW